MTHMHTHKSELVMCFKWHARQLMEMPPAVGGKWAALHFYEFSASVCYTQRHFFEVSLWTLAEPIVCKIACLLSPSRLWCRSVIFQITGEESSQVYLLGLIVGVTEGLPLMAAVHLRSGHKIGIQSNPCLKWINQIKFHLLQFTFPSNWLINKMSERQRKKRKSSHLRSSKGLFAWKVTNWLKSIV